MQTSLINLSKVVSLPQFLTLKVRIRGGGGSDIYRMVLTHIVGGDVLLYIRNVYLTYMSSLVSTHTGNISEYCTSCLFLKTWASVLPSCPV